MRRSVILAAIILVTLALSASNWPAREQGGTEMAFQNCDPDTDPPLIIYPAQDIILELDPCDGSQTGVIFFDASAIDACDPTPNLSIDVEVPTGSSLQLINPFQNTYMALASPGIYQLTLTATDISGNSRQEDFFIIVNQDAAPEPQLACIETVVVNLGPDCQRFLTADMLYAGDIGCLNPAAFHIEVEDMDPSNGPVVDGVGTFPFSVEPVQPPNLNGFAGPFAFSQWSIHIDAQGSIMPNPEGDSLLFAGSNELASAIGVLPIANNGILSFRWGTASLFTGSLFEGTLLDANGNTIITFSSADGSGGFESLFVNAGSRLVLQLLSGGEGAAPQAWLTGLDFDYSTIDISAALSCWGQIDARDAGPVLDCPDDASSLQRDVEVQQLSGSLEDSDPLFDPSIHSCFTEGPPDPGDRYYELLTFEVSEADIYTFFLESAFENGGAHIALFQGDFNPLNPCTNIIAEADIMAASNPVSGGGPALRLGLPLRPGQQYVLLTTTDVPVDTGSYTYTILSDDTGQLLNVPFSSLSLNFPLYCDDIDSTLNIQQSLEWLGTPTVESGCTDFTLSFSDVLSEEGDCGAIFITRTFTAEDEQGNIGSCEQQINFRQLTIDDVILPPRTAPIECDQAFPVDEFGNPSPDFTGFPFVATAHGIVDLRDSYCNLGASYDDGPLIEVCLLSYTFVRTWTIIDHCNADSGPQIYQQLIKIGDFSAPEVSCPVVDLTGDGFPDPLVYSTNPFECTATFSAPLPEVSDNCSLWDITIEVVTDELTIIYGPSGNPVDTLVEAIVLATILPDAPNRIVSGIPIGCHRFRYIVEDECGNQAIKECDFCVEDQIQPAASCDDSLDVSIGGNGVVRLFADFFEEGSWDNCGIDRIEVRREVRYEQDCQAVAPYFTEWGDYVDLSCCEVNSQVIIELRVMDAAGNEDYCWMEILVEDKNAAVLYPPGCNHPELR